MKKSSKAISLLLSGIMAATCFGSAAVTVSAAQADGEPTGVMTEEERLAAGHELVYFKFPEKAWGSLSGVKWNTKKHTVNVFCNFYAIYGNKKDVKSREWEAPSTSMMADAKGSDTFYFDITDSKQIAEKDDDDHKMEPGAAYGIVFSTKVNANDPNTLKPNSDGYRTCDLYFNTNCIGDTFVVDEPAKTRENTANSQKIDYCAHSRNGIGKPLRKISTLGAYIDGVAPYPAPDAFELAEFLHSYIDFFGGTSGKWLRYMMDRFETNAIDVYCTFVELYGWTSAAQRVAKLLDLPYPVPARITSVELTEECCGVTVPDDAGYTAEVFVQNNKTIFTVSPKNGYAFAAKPKVFLNGFYREMRVSYDSGKTYIDSVDGKIIVTDMPVEKLISKVELDIGSNELAAGEPVPEITAPDGAGYTVDAVWEPADSTFAYDTDYTLTAVYTAKNGYYFNETTTCETNLVVSKELTDTHMTVKVTFHTGPAPDPDAVIGDVDGDGAITIQDATLIQRRGVELEPFTAWQDRLADTDGDGRVSIFDVTCVSRYLAEMSEGFGNTGKTLREIT